MAATREDIRAWFLKGKEQGATHMLVACDTYDWTDYPVFVKPQKNVIKQVAVYQRKSMQEVMEVYDLALDMDEQLRSGRVWNTGEAVNE